MKESSWRTSVYIDPALKEEFKKKWKGSISFWIQRAMRDLVYNRCRCEKCVSQSSEFQSANKIK